MTPAEFQASINVFAREIGSNADVFAIISVDTHGQPPIGLNVYAEGMGKGSTFSIRGEDFEPLLIAARAKWSEHKDEHERQLVRRMALRIIEVTAEQGECTDAALRGTTFNAIDVERYGERASAEANDISGRGPFKVRWLRGGNGAPTDGTSQC